MSLFHPLHRLLNTGLRRYGEVTRCASLPTRFNGRWLCVPRTLWQDVKLGYEPFVARALERYLTPGGLFVDAGAHRGLWSLFAARIVGPAGQVIAVEPSPAFDHLQEAARFAPAIAPVRCALGARPADMPFHAQGESSSGSLVPAVTAINRHHLPDIPVTSITVPVRTLDSLVAHDLERLRLVKIDVEGYELEVLRGPRPSWPAGCPW